MPEKYTDGTGVVCRCLGTIANKKRSENTDDYTIDYEVQGRHIALDTYRLRAGVVCRCLGTIANKKRSENTDDYTIDYEVQGRHIALDPNTYRLRSSWCCWLGTIQYTTWSKVGSYI